MTKLEKTFADVTTYSGDIWVADYTEKSKRLPKDLRKGVVIQDSPFTDISSFCLQNKERIDIQAVNFERNQGFFPKGVENCECLFRPKSVGKGWLLLCELKYCKSGNIRVNADKAYDQLIDTWNLLEERKLFSSKRCKVFLNISVPEHGDLLAPFCSFMTNQDERIACLKKRRVHLLGVNSVLVANTGILLTIPTVI